MKKYFFLFCAFLLVACDIYTVKNNSGEDIIVGNVVLTPSQCTEFLNFPLIGDFPLQFKDEDGQSLSEGVYPAAHYVVSSQGTVFKQDSACTMKTERQTNRPPPAINPNRTHPDPHPSVLPSTAPDSTEYP